MFEGAGQRFLTLLILITIGWMIYAKRQGKDVLANLKGKMGGSMGKDFVENNMLKKGKL